MKVLDLHMTYKELYSNTIIIIKIGNFYETYDKDAIIINQITKYKLKYKNCKCQGQKSQKCYY